MSVLAPKDYRNSDRAAVEFARMAEASAIMPGNRHNEVPMRRTALGVALGGAMTSQVSRTVLFALALTVAASAAGPSWAQTRRDLKTMDVCQVVPGDAVASAVGGKLAEARPFTPKPPTFTRCTYLVDVPGGAQTTRKGYALWFYAPSDFEELRKYTEGKVTDIPGLGDGAYIFQDPGDRRFKIRVLRRGDGTIEATADTADAARQVAGIAVAWLAKRK